MTIKVGDEMINTLDKEENITNVGKESELGGFRMLALKTSNDLDFFKTLPSDMGSDVHGTMFQQRGGRGKENLQ